jgi:hypothetical protein
MALVHGKGGRFQLGGSVVYVTKWTMEMQAEEHDVTKLDTAATSTQKFRDWAVGITQWGGTFEGFVDTTTALSVGDLNTIVTGTMTDGGLKKYGGSMFMSAQTVENSAIDYARISGTYRGTGTLSIS